MNHKFYTGVIICITLPKISILNTRLNKEKQCTMIKQKRQHEMKRPRPQVFLDE
jgi:hypothetical protein